MVSIMKATCSLEERDRNHNTPSTAGNKTEKKKYG